MGEGIAASKPLEESNFSNVVQFPARPVEYTGSAMHLMNGFTLNIDTLRRALYRLNNASHRELVLDLIDKISKTMEMIQDHMDVIDENAGAISDCLEAGQEAYFLSETSKSLFEVISLIERRQTTLMVQKFSFRPAGGKLPVIAHDNNRPVLLSHEGRMACQWPRSPKPTPPAKISKRRRAR